MNLEQIEGHLAEFEGKKVSVTVPIRGTAHMIFSGNLQIEHDWENHTISYRVDGSNPFIHFQAKDVESMCATQDNSMASIVLKSDTWMEQSKYTHA